MQNYWLLKSEPSVFSIQDLKRKGEEPWDGVRNYQARNYLRDSMQQGDLALFYHSNCEIPGVAGICEIAGPAEPDPSQWDPSSDHFDPIAKPEAPRWWLRRVRFQEEFSQVISLQDLREEPKLKDLLILRKGNRLSVTPLLANEFKTIRAIAHKRT